MALLTYLKRATVVGIATLGLASLGASAAQDYNSSRSNTTAAIDFGGDTTEDEIKKLIEEARAEALAVARRMVALEERQIQQRLNESGRFKNDVYRIRVTVGVEIERLDDERAAAVGGR